MAQQTAQSVMALPGVVHSFLAKTAPPIPTADQHPSLRGITGNRTTLRGIEGMRVSLRGVEGNRTTLKGDV